MSRGDTSSNTGTLRDTKAVSLSDSCEADNLQIWRFLWQGDLKQKFNSIKLWKNWGKYKIITKFSLISSTIQIVFREAKIHRCFPEGAI